MITRLVMVEFHPHVGPDDIACFEQDLQGLAARTDGLLRMSCGQHAETMGDELLRRRAPQVVFGNFASIWEFEDRHAVDKFLVDPTHAAMAARWREWVKQRYVINIA